jgi:hypothetical protein
MSQHEILARLARTMPVESFLEVGVRDGGTLWAVVEADYEHLQLVACADNWLDAHGGTDRKTHDHIDRLLSAVLYYYRKGEVIWLDGDSAAQLPALLDREPDRRFDLVHIDGDHSEGHALIDLRNGWNLTRGGGGVIVCHDVNYVEVRNAWREFLDGCEAEDLADYYAFGTGRGTGVAIRA